MIKTATIKVKFLQYTGDNIIDVLKFIGNNKACVLMSLKTRTKHLVLKAWHGEIIVDPRCYIVKVNDDECYAITPEEFEQNYHPEH